MAKNLTTRNTEADLKTAYLLAFDNFATEPVEVGNAVKGNSRYGRELLGTLVRGGLLCNTLVNGSDQVWQCLQTYDSIDREEALRLFEQWLDSQAPEDETPEAKPATSLAKCLCGCGELANKNRDYRPGHDARHAGNVGRKIAQHFNAGQTRLADDLLATLPSPALRTKALAVAAKANRGNQPTANTNARREAALAKAEAEALPVREPVQKDGTVKKGRWTYPAKSLDGVVFISRSRKNTNEWDEADAKTAATFTA